VPADLSVHVPSLEDALLGVLAGAAGAEAAAQPAHKQAELAGGRR
jgi:hypothetical protein